MKRAMLLIIAVLGFSCIGECAYTPQGVNIDTYISLNTSSANKTTNVSTTTIPTYAKILGYKVISESASSGTWAALYDCASGGNNVNTLFGDVVIPVLGWDGVWFPYPRHLDTQLTITQGAYTRVIVYYVKE